MLLLLLLLLMMMIVHSSPALLPHLLYHNLHSICVILLAPHL
jgi:hypothetical protein